MSTRAPLNAPIGSLKVKKPGYESDSGCAENCWLGTVVGSSFGPCACCVPNCCLSWAKAEFCRWRSSCCFISCRRTCCWLAVCWGCENDCVENAWLVGDGWGRMIFCCGWKRGCNCCWVAFETGNAGTMICCKVFTCVGFCCFSFSCWLTSVACGRTVFPCCCRTRPLTFLCKAGDEAEDDETPCCTVDRFISGRLTCGSFVLLSLISAPFAIFRSSGKEIARHEILIQPMKFDFLSFSLTGHDWITESHGIFVLWLSHEWSHTIEGFHPQTERSQLMISSTDSKVSPAL